MAEMQEGFVPFALGTTYYAGRTIDANNLIGTEWEGYEVTVGDDAVAGSPTHRTRRSRTFRCVRNVGAAALLPKQLVTFQATAGVYGARVDGKAKVLNERSYPIDEALPAAGCPVNDLCWICVAGPHLCITALEGTAVNVINVGDKLVAQTAATSGATTAGRAVPITDFAGANSTGTALANAVLHYIGTALSAKTTANTNADVLVEIGKW